MKKCLLGLLAVFLICTVSVTATATEAEGRNPREYITTAEQEASIASIINIDDGMLYSMDYTADYKLDEMLAAGVDDLESLAAFVRQSLLNGCNEEVGAINPGCSAFTAQSPDGAILFGRNFDYDNTDTTAILVRTTPENGYASIALAPAGMLGWYGKGSLDDGTTDLSLLAAMPYFILDGVNEKGLAITVLELEYDHTRQDTGKPVISTTVAMRLALDRAANVDEAIALFESYDMVSVMQEYDYHFFLADATGRAVVLEYCDNVLYVLDDTYVTNFYLEPSHDMPEDYDKRYPILQSVLSFRENVLTPQQAMCLLQLVGREAPDEFTTITQWSVLYDLTNLNATVVIKQNLDKQFTFSINDISGHYQIGQ